MRACGHVLLNWLPTELRSVKGCLSDLWVPRLVKQLQRLMINTTFQVLHADCCWLSYYSVVVEKRTLVSMVPGILPSQLEICLLAKLKLASRSSLVTSHSALRDSCQLRPALTDSGQLDQGSRSITRRNYAIGVRMIQLSNVEY